MLDTEILLHRSGARHTGFVAREVAWGCKVHRWGPRDWWDLWCALDRHPFRHRLYYGVRLWRVIWQDRRLPWSQLVETE